MTGKGDPGTRWYRARLPRADTFSTKAPGPAFLTLAIRRLLGKVTFRVLTAEC